MQPNFNQILEIINEIDEISPNTKVKQLLEKLKNIIKQQIETNENYYRKLLRYQITIENFTMW